MTGICDGAVLVPAGELARATTEPRYVHPHKPSAKAERRVVCPPDAPPCWHDQCHPEVYQ